MTRHPEACLFTVKGSAETILLMLLLHRPLSSYMIARIFGRLRLREKYPWTLRGALELRNQGKVSQALVRLSRRGLLVRAAEPGKHGAAIYVFNTDALVEMMP